MAHFYLQGLLLLVLLMNVADSEDVSTVTASQEEDAALPCINSTVINAKSCYRVKWKKWATDSGQVKDILAWPKTSKIQDAERVKWEADGNGQMSLFLTKLQKSDEGLYSCEIWQGWDCTLVKNIFLKVKECKILQAVKPAPGASVNLTCPVNTTSGQQVPQNISWVKLRGESNRVKINRTSLIIQSVNSTDHGWYRCTYKIGQTQRCFDINLLVGEGNAAPETKTFPALTTMTELTTSEIIFQNRNEPTETNWASILVAPIIIAIAIIAAVIGLFIHVRRKAQSVAQYSQRHPAVHHTDSVDCYENIHLATSEDPLHQRVNSLYHQCQEESLCTFHY